jgi:hypothetical protein
MAGNNKQKRRTAERKARQQHAWNRMLDEQGQREILAGKHFHNLSQIWKHLVIRKFGNA